MYVVNKADDPPAAESSGKKQEARLSDTLIWNPGLAYTGSNEKHRRRVDAFVVARRSFRSFLFRPEPLLELAERFVEMFRWYRAVS